MNLKIIMGRLFATLALFMVCVSSIAADVATNDNDDRAEFARWLEKAEAGDADAQFQVALRHGRGRGVPEDEAKAAEWFEKAALQGHVKAQRMIALSYQLGRGVEVNKDKAVEWFRKAAAQGDEVCQFQLGVALLGKSYAENEKNALPWLLKSAENGSSSGQHMCGVYYKEGWGGKEDMKSAAYWFEKAAEKNEASSQREIGICYNFGYGVKRDFDKAFYWFTKAAKQGDMEACRRLGRCYEYGFGTAKDMEQAAAWYAEAADKGDEKAQEWLKTRQHVADASQNDATAKEVRAKKAQELIEKASGQNGVFAVGGFYIGMPVSDAEFLLRHYFPEMKVGWSLKTEDIVGNKQEMMSDGIWLGNEEQCFCRTDKNGNVTRLNFYGDILTHFMDYGDLTPDRWVKKFIDENGGAAFPDEIMKYEVQNGTGISVEQPVWRISLKSDGKITFFGQDRGHLDEEGDWGMLNYLHFYMIKYVNDEGGKPGTLRVE